MRRRARRLFVEWELVAQSMLETFRFDLAPHLEDPRARRLLDHFHAASPAFAAYWAPHRIRTHPDGLQHLAHPTMGALRLEATLMTPQESPTFRLLMLVPADAATAARIDAATSRTSSLAASRSHPMAQTLAQPAPSLGALPTPMGERFE